jgi:hypothetical protein
LYLSKVEDAMARCTSQAAELIAAVLVLKLEQLAQARPPSGEAAINAVVLGLIIALPWMIL